MIYAVYRTSDTGLVLVTINEAQAEEYRSTPYFIEVYERLTLSQVNYLPYATAKACETLMRTQPLLPDYSRPYEAQEAHVG